MKTETVIMKTQLKNLFDPNIIEALCSSGYRKTGNKFSLCFNGSKGYLDNITIKCEGIQQADNRINRNDIFTQKRGIRSKIVNVFHSEQLGVRISFGQDKSRIIKSPSVSKQEQGAISRPDDLPF